MTDNNGQVHHNHIYESKFKIFMCKGGYLGFFFMFGRTCSKCDSHADEA